MSTITSENIFKEALLGQLRDLQKMSTGIRLSWIEQQIEVVAATANVTKETYVSVLKEFIKL